MTCRTNWSVHFLSTNPTVTSTSGRDSNWVALHFLHETLMHGVSSPLHAQFHVCTAPKFHHQHGPRHSMTFSRLHRSWKHVTTPRLPPPPSLLKSPSPHLSSPHVIPPHLSSSSPSSPLPTNPTTPSPPPHPTHNPQPTSPHPPHPTISSHLSGLSPPPSPFSSHLLTAQGVAWLSPSRLPLALPDALAAVLHASPVPPFSWWAPQCQ